MKFVADQKEELEINLTSLIDVVFLLLIFFMVSTTFDHQSKLKVTLPEASATEQLEPQQVLEIVINKEGHYFLAGQELINIERKTLVQALKKLAAGNYKQPLRIRADANTPHSAVVRAMDVAGELGFEGLSIATTEPSKAKN
ncbi:MAG: ExbD/TolR family protein [bacterium]